MGRSSFYLAEKERDHPPTLSTIKVKLYITHCHAQTSGNSTEKVQDSTVKVYLTLVIDIMCGAFNRITKGCIIKRANIIKTPKMRLYYIHNRHYQIIFTV